MKLLTVCALLCALMALTSAAVKSPPETSVCPRGWTLHNYRCFIYVKAHMSWANAERNCQFLNANLASVHNDWEYFVIQNLTAINGKRQAWIGGTDAPQETFWFWSDGNPFRYSNWCPGQPSNGPSEHCLRINYSGAKCWDDVRCAIRLPSVCAARMERLLE